ncbi:MAG: hypothetical protein KDE32_14885 [Novosphingobium sp.]|nr:hypothetical protein [Novosphingobium sp.]
MAKVKPSKSGNKPPLTRHPLFPATVALWFGALFGIGSLAIRPSLFEGIVVSLGIDAIAPIMAPPLGATTRILLALAMAALGGTLGAKLARRIARPKPVTVQRKRGAGKTSVAGESGLAARGSRRAALAPSYNDDARPVYDDHAPVPGSANILDVSQFDLDGFEADIEEQAEGDEIAFEPEPVSPVSADSWQPAETFERIPQGAQVFQPVTDEAPSRELPESREDAGIDTDDQNFRDFSVPAASRPDVREASDTIPASVSLDEDEQSASEPAARADVPTEISPQVFDAHDNDPEIEPIEVNEETDEQPLERLGGKSADPYAPLPPKTRPGSIFDQQPAAGLFAKPLNAQVAHVGWDNASSRDTAPAAPVDEPSVEVVVPDLPPPADEPHGADPEPTASERIEQAPLDDLSHVELLERLALSMRRKRTQPAVAEEIAAVAPEPVEIQESAQPQVEAAATAVEERPAPPVPTIPDALRPIGLDDDEEADLLPAFVPPRHFVQPQADSSAVANPSGNAVSDQPEPTLSQAEAADELEEGYSSLLSLSRPGAGSQRFVRIEEPAPLSNEVEPVVVFPGKEPVVGEGPFARPSASNNGPAPTTAAAAGEESADSATKRLDSEETDRALRTALANLQRMSGAA